MSADRVVFWMIVGWIALVAVLIFLDWLGNPDRGSFRPKGDRELPNRRLRRVERIRRRLENDAAVRAALRDAYGASSMRLSWSDEKESRARALDDALVVQDLDERIGVVDVGSREVRVAIDHTRAVGDPLPNPEERPPGPQPDPDRPGDGDAPDAAPPADRPVGWTVGVDPLALTRKGTEPSPSTVRQRVWKNLGQRAGWDDANIERLQAGKPPRRHNPITGKDERGIVDTHTGTASWGSEPIDPFAPADPEAAM